MHYNTVTIIRMLISIFTILVSSDSFALHSLILILFIEIVGHHFCRLPLVFLSVLVYSALTL